MNYQSYIFPVAVILFFGYKFFKNRQLKKILPELIKNGAIIIDVRSASEFTSAHNPISRNVPLDQFSNESKKLDQDKTYILCCASGTRSGIALGIMKKNGFKNVLNAGTWSNTLS
jgi:rhodanese-related sulfurtransferase